jgi:D-glycero-alpha-D-manno-heptose-7-phosphate kinase
MIRGLSTLVKQPMTKQRVAELAFYIEISKMGMPIGKQDQCAVAFSGLKKINFTPEGVPSSLSKSRPIPAGPWRSD